MSDARVYRNYLGRYVAVEFIVALYINMVLSAFFFWNYASIPFFGDASIVGDLLGTAAILPVVVGLIVVSRVRKHRHQGKLPMPDRDQPTGLAARILPSPVWQRLVVLVIHGVLAAVIAVVVLWILGIDAMPFWPFVIIQGTFAGVLAAYIVAISVERVIGENRQERELQRSEAAKARSA